MAFMRMMWLVVTITFGVFLESYLATPDIRVLCFGTGNGPRATIRVRPNDGQVTGLQVFDSSIDPTQQNAVPIPYTDSECITSSYTTSYSGIYSLTIDDTECGGQDNRQIKLVGINSYIQFTCIGGGYTIGYTDFDYVTVVPTHEVPFQHVYPNPFDIKCMVFAASGWNAPIWEATYGQDLKLRCIFNKGKMGDARDSWGRVFYIAFPSHTDADFIGIEIYTKGTGTRAKVTGNLSGSTIDERVYVKRDHPYRRNIIDPSYGDTISTDSSWVIEDDRVIKVEAMDDDIAVRVISYSSTEIYRSSYLAQPEHLLSDDYRVPSLKSPSHEDAEVLIYAVTDNTDVTITYNSFDDEFILQVGTVSTMTTPTTTTTRLDAGETLTVRCDSDCSDLVLTGDENFGVVFSMDEKEHTDGSGVEGHIMTQITPKAHFGKEFVLVTPAGIAGTFVTLQDTPTATNFEISYTGGTTQSSFTHFPSSTNSHAKFDEPVAIYFHTEGNSTKDPGILPIPSVAQWGNNYYFYARMGRTYTLTFIGKDLDKISFTTGSAVTDLTGTKLEDQTNYASNKDQVFTLWTDSRDFYTYELIVTVTGTIQQENGGLIEFEAEKKWHSFGLYIIETWDGHAEAYLPMGVRWTLSPDETVTDADFIRPGDGKDNDDNGHVGEDIPNGQNDDDVAEHEIHDATGIFVRAVLVCGDSWVDCYAMYESCYLDYYDDQRPDNSHLRQFERFEHNTDLADEFDHLYVIDSTPFNAWRSISPSASTIQISILYGMCFGNLTLCENSCKEKRSTEHHETWAATTKIPFHVNSEDKISETESATSDDFSSHPCSGNPVFWIPVSMLMIIVLIQSMATVFFLFKRSQFIKHLKTVSG